MKKLSSSFHATDLILGSKEQKPEEPSITEMMKTYILEQMMDNESIGGEDFSKRVRVGKMLKGTSVPTFWLN